MYISKNVYLSIQFNYELVIEGAIQCLDVQLDARVCMYNSDLDNLLSIACAFFKIMHAHWCTSAQLNVRLAMVWQSLSVVVHTSRYNASGLLVIYCSMIVLVVVYSS